MIFIIWENIKDGFADFLFSFRALFCKNYYIDSRGLDYCMDEESKIYDDYGYAVGRKDCCRENCPKRKRGAE